MCMCERSWIASRGFTHSTHTHQTRKFIRSQKEEEDAVNSLFCPLV